MVKNAIIGASLLLFSAVGAQASLVGVSGPNSSEGGAAQIIASPAEVKNNSVTNLRMQGFDEVLNFVLTSDISVDGGGTILAGTKVDSHMIFMNRAGGGSQTHFGVDWTFAGEILGVMSDGSGALEVASTPQLGASGTIYEVFNNRGLEGNNGTGIGNDGYAILAPNVLRVGMQVSQPGDWIRVVTAPAPIPLPAGLPLAAAALGALGLLRTRRKA